MQVPVAAGLDCLVDTDSELKQVDVEEEAELEPEVHKSPPGKPRTRKNELPTKPPGAGAAKQQKGSSFASSVAPPLATDKFIGTMSTPANEEHLKPAEQIKRKKASPPRKCKDTILQVTADSSAQETTTSTKVQCVELPSAKDVPPLARICANAFTRSTSEQAKEEVMRTVFRMIQDQSPIELVVDTMTMIRQSLEQEQASVVIYKLEGLQRTSEFATQY